MNRIFILSIEIDDSWLDLTDEKVREMLVLFKEGHGIKITDIFRINEASIMDMLLKHGDMLTCFNCGKNLTEAETKKINTQAYDRFIAKLILDPGESNYPREPDVPASLYFVCSECATEEAPNEKVI